MLQNSSNYMDGVPVKIAEKYKPPPKVSLPQSIIQKLINPSAAIASVTTNYDFNLERSVLAKVNELKAVRQQECYDRRERIRRRQEERHRQLTEKQKELLTAVSYPSTDDLSLDDEIRDTTTITITTEAATAAVETVTAENHIQNPLNSFDNILVPTVVPGHHNLTPSNLNETNCKTMEVNQNHPCTNNISSKYNFNRINYSDFENDTSSPFDNVELKTINDLDILAQVLNITRIQHSNAESSNVITVEDDNSPIKLQTITDGTSNQNDNLINKNVQFSFDINASTQSTINNVQLSNPNFNQNIIQSHQPYSHASQQHQQQQQQQQQHIKNQIENTYSNYPMTNCYLQQPQRIGSEMDNRSYICDSVPPQLHQQHQPSLSPNNAYKTSLTINYNMFSSSSGDGGGSGSGNSGYSGCGSIKQVENKFLEQLKESQSKSKSVPDILRELSDEVRDSQMKRVRNNSQTISDGSNCPIVETIYPTDNKSNKQQQSNKTFHRLSSSAQLLAQNISTMGFPLDQVSRVVELIGKDDKKIVEHLIPLGELLDLGFDETKISEALIKFDNNKEKALDFLIS